MQSELSVEDVKWALLVVGICLMIWGIHDYGYVNKTPVNIANIQSYDIQNGMVVEGEIPCNYGVFDKEVQYKNDGPNENRYYYLISLGVPSNQVDSILVDYYIQFAYFSAWKPVLIIGIIMTAVGAVMIISQYTVRIKK